MNTQYLSYALEVQKAGSITKAAQNLYMAQPNLSKAIKDLEENLGYAVFKRSAGGMEITENGKQFLKYADRIVKQLNEMDKIADHENEKKVSFRVSIPRGSYIANGIAEFVSELDHEKKIDISIHETNSMNTIDNVANRYYNLGIIRYQSIYEEYFLRYLGNNGLRYESIWEFEFVLIMSNRHKLAEKEVITPQDLEEYIEITHGDVTIPYLENKEAFDREPDKKKVIYVYERGSQFDLLENVPTTYMWVSPVPDSYLERYKLVQRVCRKPDNRYKDVLIYRDDYLFTEYDKLFQKNLYASKIEVSSRKYE